MTDSRLRLAAQAVVDLTGPFMGDEHRAALKALRRALAEPAEEPGVPTVDECERIAFKAGVEAAAKWHDDLGADDTPHGARGHAWYASQIRALAAPVEAHGDAPDGYCPKCRADICAQLAAAYDAGRESVEVAAALAPKCGSEQDDEDTYRRRVAQPAATGEGECPDCNDGILTRAFAEPHDIPCPTCNGTMRAPPLAPVPSGPREGDKT